MPSRSEVPRRRRALLFLVVDSDSSLELVSHLEGVMVDRERGVWRDERHTEEYAIGESRPSGIWKPEVGDVLGVYYRGRITHLRRMVGAAKVFGQPPFGSVVTQPEYDPDEPRY